MDRECTRYNMNTETVAAAVRGEEAFTDAGLKRHWWEAVIVAAAVGVFIWLGLRATPQQIAVNTPWMMILSALSLVFLFVCGWVLYKKTKFS
jgi:cytochrome bd-type quinol oxidase subunit 2